MGLKRSLRSMWPSVTARGKTNSLRAKAGIAGDAAAKKSGPKAKVLETKAGKLRKRVTRRTSIRPSLHMAFANALRKLDVVKFRSPKGLGAFKNTRVGYNWGALSSAIKVKLKYFKVVDPSVILADIKKALKEGKSLSEFAEKYGSAKIVKKPAPKSSKPTANIRLAGLLERIKTPEAQILTLLRDPNRRAEVTKIFANLKLTNTDKVVAQVEKELAAGKTFKQMAAKLRAGKSKK